MKIQTAIREAMRTDKSIVRDGNSYCVYYIGINKKEGKFDILGSETNEPVALTLEEILATDWKIVDWRLFDEAI